MSGSNFTYIEATLQSTSTITGSLSAEIVLLSSLTASNFFSGYMILGETATLSQSASFSTPTLITAIPLVATLAADSTVNASLSTQILLNGTPTFSATNSFAGTLSTGIVLYSTLTQASSLAASLMTQAALAATLSSNVVISGSLTTQLRIDPSNILSAPTISNVLLAPAGT